MRHIALAAALLFPCCAAWATEPVLCTTRISGHDVPLGYDKDEEVSRNNYSRREVLFTTWGRDTCPSFVVLRSLTPGLTDEERRPFCLRYDKASDSTLGYDFGGRDAYGRCETPSKSVCQRVNQTRDAAVALTGAATRGAVNGVRALPDGSGAAIVKGSGGFISSTLGALGGAAGALAASPMVAAGAAVSLVAVGGAVYACSGAEG